MNYRARSDPIQHEAATQVTADSETGCQYDGVCHMNFNFWFGIWVHVCQCTDLLARHKCRHIFSTFSMNT